MVQIRDIIKAILFTGVLIAARPGFAIEQELQHARQLFYQSIDDEQKLKPAIELFQKIYDEQEPLRGRALTYLGSLYAIQGKHAFSPYKKFNSVLKGLKIMDQGLAVNADDIEALFIHGSTCHALPFFFNRKDQAQQNFKKIILLLPTEATHYAPELIVNVIEFIETHCSLNADEIQTLVQLKERVETDEQ